MLLRDTEDFYPLGREIGLFLILDIHMPLILLATKITSFCGWVVAWVSSFQNQRYQMRSQHVSVSLVAQSRRTLSNPMDCTPGSSVRGVLQVRILEWVTMPSSGESSLSMDQTHVFGIAGGFFTTEPPEKPIAGHVSCQHKIISVCELFCQPQGSSTRDRIVQNP